MTTKGMLTLTGNLLPGFPLAIESRSDKIIEKVWRTLLKGESEKLGESGLVAALRDPETAGVLSGLGGIHRGGQSFRAGL